MTPSSKLPLKPQQFYILLALAERERHGSSIMREVLDLTEGHLRLWPAMLYSSLEQLVEESWIEELKGGERPRGESERRRYYRLTAEGRESLVAEARRLSRLVRIARSRVRLGEGETV